MNISEVRYLESQSIYFKMNITRQHINFLWLNYPEFEYNIDKETKKYLYLPYYYSNNTYVIINDIFLEKNKLHIYLILSEKFGVKKLKK